MVRADGRGAFHTQFVYKKNYIKKANFLWIQLFNQALNKTGRSGFVMANSASDEGGNSLEIRKKLIEDNRIDILIGVGSKFFYTVALPCTLWFLDATKKDSNRKDKILFIDAQKMFTEIDRAHREFSAPQIDEIVNVVKQYRSNPNGLGNKRGFYRVVDFKEIREENYSLSPARYVGIDLDPIDFDLSKEVDKLNLKLSKLDKNYQIEIKKIIHNAKRIAEEIKNG